MSELNTGNCNCNVKGRYKVHCTLQGTLYVTRYTVRYKVHCTLQELEYDDSETDTLTSTTSEVYRTCHLTLCTAATCSTAAAAAPALIRVFFYSSF